MVSSSLAQTACSELIWFPGGVVVGPEFNQAAFRLEL